MRFDDLYTRVPWGDVQPSDVCAQGEPEYTRDLKGERQLALCVRGTYGANLGMLALRCERHGETVCPLSMLIVDDGIYVGNMDTVPVQSNPRRVEDREDR